MFISSQDDADAEDIAHCTPEASKCSRVILLAGAPVVDALTWTDDHLTVPLYPQFIDGVLDQRHDLSHTLTNTAQDSGLPLWRSVDLIPARLHTGDTLPTPQLQLIGDSGRHNGTASFLSKASSTSQAQVEGSKAANTDDDSQHRPMDDDFLEHSLYLHDEMPSSQILLTNPSQQDSISFEATESFPSIVSGQSGGYSQTVLGTEADTANKRLSLIQITPLIEVPTATKLISLQPQTLTHNILIGVISVPSAPRQIFPRRWPSGPSRSLDLLEPIVGDPSRSGFTVSLWLGLTPPHEADRDGPPLRGQVTTAAEQLMRRTALSLRRGDVVLFRNLAMASWQGQVFGQSLRRGLTTIEILHRTGGHDGGVFSARNLATTTSTSHNHPVESMLDSIRVVRDWLSTIIPPDAVGRRQDPRLQRSRNDTHANHIEHTATDYRTLPPDTPV